MKIATKYTVEFMDSIFKNNQRKENASIIILLKKNNLN